MTKMKLCMIVVMIEQQKLVNNECVTVKETSRELNKVQGQKSAKGMLNFPVGNVGLSWKGVEGSMVVVTITLLIRHTFKRTCPLSEFNGRRTLETLKQLWIAVSEMK